MPIVDLFSKRQARLRGEMPDVYRYDEVPETLRAQLVYVVLDLLNGGDSRRFASHHEVALAYEVITGCLCREYGLFRLSGADYERRDPQAELLCRVQKIWRGSSGNFGGSGTAVSLAGALRVARSTPACGWSS